MDYIFNQPQIEIAKNGHLVMARNGSFTAPGTLLRTEDTLGTKNLRQRLPINYLQYAASGAPNVYSDTIGFRNMDQYSKEVMRHGWPHPAWKHGLDLHQKKLRSFSADIRAGRSRCSRSNRPCGSLRQALQHFV
jgi:hypothetical protein